jgi:hypothetical protein
MNQNTNEVFLAIISNTLRGLEEIANTEPAIDTRKKEMILKNIDAVRLENNLQTKIFKTNALTYSLYEQVN